MEKLFNTIVAIYLLGITIYVSCFLASVRISEYQQQKTVQTSLVQSEKEDVELNSIVCSYFVMLEKYNIKYNIGNKFRVSFVIMPDDNTIGIAIGMEDDSKVEIYIDYLYWLQAAHNQKVALVYHELSHDVFNIHHNELELMKPVIAEKVTDKDLARYNKELIRYLKHHKPGDKKHFPWREKPRRRRNN